MSETGKERFILTKSYEIAYALFRLAPQIEEKDFSERLRTAGATLLAATAEKNYTAAIQALQVTECLVKFAGDVNVIGTANADIILREIYALDAAIAEQKNSVKSDEVNVEEIFSKPEISARSQEFAAEIHFDEPAIRQTTPQTRSTATSESAPKMHSINEQDYKRDMGEEVSKPLEQGPNNISGILKSAIRQTAILERIRQTGNCRLKDIQEILPECSERTIRYDLQTLLEQDLIERIGNAGPSVYYQARNVA
jgi:hypothetical protein